METNEVDLAKDIYAKRDRNRTKRMARYKETFNCDNGLNFDRFRIDIELKYVVSK